MPGRRSGGLPATLREPLAESAPIASALAEKLCDRTNPDSSCLFYHSAWQYFRLIGLIRTISADDDFLCMALSELAATGRFDRVLISGSADYGMLARVIQAYRAAGREPEVTLVDICRTPLELNLWLAKREGLRLDTVHGDMLGFTSHRPYDLICTHSFIGRFYGTRAALLGTWNALLRPGGRIVTTTRVRPGITEVVGFSPPEIEMFTARAVELAGSCRSLGAEKPERIAEWARQYAQRKVNYPLESCEEFAAYFTQAGLRVTWIDRVSGQGDRPSGPRLGIPSERVRLIAARP